MYDEQGNEILEGVAVLSSSETASVAGDAPLDSAPDALGQEKDILGQTAEESVEAAVESPGVPSEVSTALDAERVEQIVDAVLESDRVAGLMQSLEEMLETVADVVTVALNQEPAEPPMLVISADDLLDRLEARQAETAKAAETEQASVRSSPMGGQTVAASMTKGGELALPEEGEVTLEVIQALIEGLISFFTQDGTEDETDVLTSIKDTVEEIRANVEPHSMMDTPFADYTVTEGLLLVAVLWFVVLNPCIRMIKGGFSWLLQ